MPDRMPENMSDRMPEDLPVTKCINVLMVGITRSKVIDKSMGQDPISPEGHHGANEDFGMSSPLQMAKAGSRTRASNIFC